MGIYLPNLPGTLGPAWHRAWQPGVRGFTACTFSLSGTLACYLAPCAFASSSVNEDSDAIECCHDEEMTGCPIASAYHTVLPSGGVGVEVGGLHF